MAIGAMPSTTDTFLERVGNFVMGGSHIGTGGDLLTNRPSEGSRATCRALDDPSRENIAHYLRVHIDDESLVTDELVDYIHRAHTWSPEFIEARRQSVRLPHDYTQDLAQIQAAALLIHGLRPDGAVRGLDRDPQSHHRLAPGAAQQPRAPAALREAGRVDRAGPRLPQGLLTGRFAGWVGRLVAAGKSGIQALF
jgi:hypothetical protein